ncbi:MAG: nucleotidyltransferase family protein [Phototrophicaceae bacterium]|jgi:predicted nucleotidyltransferase
MIDHVKSPPTLDDLRARRDEILQIAMHYGVSDIQIFGSVARHEATPTSDIDLLVTFPPEFSLLRLSGLVGKLQQLLGCRVDVASADHLRDEFRDDILRDAVPL